MQTKKKTLRREPSHTPKFILTAIIVLLVVLLTILLAKFTTLKTLFWLE